MALKTMNAGNAVNKHAQLPRFEYAVVDDDDDNDNVCQL